MREWAMLLTARRRATQTRRWAVPTSLVVASGLMAAGCTGLDAQDRPDPAKVELVAFDSCEQALAGLKQATLPHVGAYGLGEPFHAVAGGARALQGVPDGGGVAGSGAQSLGAAEAAEPGAPTRRQTAPRHSTTNVHESGVDEPDLVKTNGHRMVTVADGKLRVIDLASRRLTGTLKLPGGPATQLLTYGQHALVMVLGHPWDEERPGEREFRLVRVDLSGEPRVAETLRLEGSYVNARRVGAVARVVLRSRPDLPFLYPGGPRSESAAQRANRQVVKDSSIGDWLPRYVLTPSSGEVRRGRLVDCDRVLHPEVYSGGSMLTVLTVDLRRGLNPRDPLSVVANGGTVYGTKTNLYVADDTNAPVVPLPGGSSAEQPVRPRTVVHKFGTSRSGRVRYVASGAVPGVLLNQYALSAYEGHLRVATTTRRAPELSPRRPGTRSPDTRSPDTRSPDTRSPDTRSPDTRSPDTQSRVTVLAQRGDRLEPVGSVGGLGKGQRIYAVRFMGPVGYVVTFRQIDPLYTLDLSDPRRPRVVGELKITGYSAYLHPAGGGRLIGVGQQATKRGRLLGTQVSLFDVSDPSRPRRIGGYQLRYGQSEVEFDPHAFLYWPPRDLVVVPVTSPMIRRAIPDRPDVSGTPDPAGAAEPGSVPDPPGGSASAAVRAHSPRGGALVLRLSDGDFAKVGMVTHPDGPDPGQARTRRSVVVGDTLWTVSPAGAMASDITDLSRQAWVPFR